ncbi:MAG: fatty acyl-AMP ligase [Deltaproteobacteria bacterium]|nr:fatty acyl-AMP ligase [Deltaproteobacteria bacterium]
MSLSSESAHPHAASRGADASEFERESRVLFGDEVPPTLVHALRRLRDFRHRGFYFINQEGKERFCSFGEMHDEAGRRGRILRDLGLAKGDRVAIVVPEGDEFVLSFMGALYAGVIPVPIYPRLTLRNLEAYVETVGHIADASGARVVVTSPNARQYVEGAVGKSKLEALVTTEQLCPHPGPHPAGGDTIVPIDEHISPDDICFLQFTSGSTARPKGVRVLHRNLATNCGLFMLDGLRRRESWDKGVSWLPLFHDMGLIGFVMGPLFTNIESVFLPTSSFARGPRIWLETIHRHRGTITYAPNFAYALAVKRLRDRDLVGLDLSSLRISGCGAEPIQAGVLREFAKRLEPVGFKSSTLLPSYGMAEATLAITFIGHDEEPSADRVVAEDMGRRIATPATAETPEGKVAEIVSCGRPFRDHELRIVDDEGNVLGERRVGQIITRGPSIADGYFDNPAATAESFRADGWLYTGDLGYVADGNLYVCGRVKDMIIVRGRNFYPQDIEWLVGEMPSVRRGNVIAFAVSLGDTEGVVVCAEAAMSDEAALVPAIVSRVTDEVGIAPHDVAIVPLGTLPKTSSGKPQRRKTKQMYEDGTLRRIVEDAKSARAVPQPDGV